MKEYILPSLILGTIGAFWFHFIHTGPVHFLVFFIPGVIGVVYFLLFGEGEEQNPLLGFFAGQIIIPMIGIIIYYFPILVLPWILFALAANLVPHRKREDTHAVQSATTVSEKRSEKGKTESNQDIDWDFIEQDILKRSRNDKDT